MIGLQVSVNGKPLYTIGIGELGMLSTKVEWARLPTKASIHEHLYVGASGLVATKHPEREMPKHLNWQNHRLQMGDEVTIKVVEIDAHDPPLPGMPDFPISN